MPPPPRGPHTTGNTTRGGSTYRRGGTPGRTGPQYTGGFPPAGISTIGNNAVGSSRGLNDTSAAAAAQMQPGGRGGRGGGPYGRGGQGGGRGGGRGGRGGGRGGGAPRQPLPTSTGTGLGAIESHRLTRGRDGLITRIDGRPVDAWLKDKTAERIQHHRARGTFTTDPHECIAVGVDLKTGRVYEGINGPRGNVIPPGHVHPFIDQRVNEVRQLPHIDRSGNLTTGQPHGDAPLRHAEVKAANEMLNDRTADAARNPQAYPRGITPDRALRQFAVNTHFPNSGVSPGGTQAPFCVNCNHILHGASSVQGRFTGNPPRDGIVTPGGGLGPNWNP